MRTDRRACARIHWIRAAVEAMGVYETRSGRCRAFALNLVTSGSLLRRDEEAEGAVRGLCTVALRNSSTAVTAAVDLARNASAATRRQRTLAHSLAIEDASASSRPTRSTGCGP